MTKPSARTLLVTTFWLVALLLAGWAVRQPTLGHQQWNLDEACTFTMAQQIREGGVLYRDAVDHRGPLVPYLKAAIFAVAGDWNVHAVRVALALAIGFAAFLLRDLARRFGDALTGSAAALIFLVLSIALAGTSDSFASHTEWFVVSFSVLGLWIFSYAHARGELVSGLVIGVVFAGSALCKQPGLLDLGVLWVLLALWAWWHPAERARLFRLWLGTAAGVLVIGCAAAAYFWQYGALRDFVYYAWRYNVEIYVPEMSRWQRLSAVRVPFILAAKNAPALGLLAIGGVAALLRLATRELRAPAKDRSLLPWLILGWCASGLVSTALSGRDFEHYSIQLIPGLSLAAGWSVARLLERTRTQLAQRRSMALLGLTVLLAAVAVTTWNIRVAYRKLPPGEQDGWFELQKLVQSYSSPTERLFVWGYYPDGYLLSHRMPATRFINANFLTGMVPWTNLEYERDTRYAIVPGAWDAFWRDYRQHPPAVILDAVTRGYVKYRILAQPKLRDEVIDHFAEVHRFATDPFHVRVLRRIDATSREIPAQLTVDNDIRLLTRTVYQIPDILEVTVVAPQRGAEVVLRLGGRPYRRLKLPKDSSVEVSFTVRISDLVSKGTSVADAVVFDGDRALQSPPVDLNPRYQLDPHVATPAPSLRYGNEQFSSTGGEQRTWFDEPRSSVLGWRTAGSFTLEFPRASAMEAVSWIWQPPPLRRGVREPIRPLLPEISLVTDHGVEPLTRNEVTRQEGQCFITTELPRGQRGSLRVQWSGVVSADYASNEVWIGGLKAFARGPALNFAEREISPTEGSALGDKPWTRSPNGTWAGDAPSRLVYPRVAHLNSFVFDYGINERVYTNPPAGVGEGVIIEVNFLHADGHSENLLSDAVHPQADPKSRGKHHVRVGLPENDAPGRIEIKFKPLPENNPVGAETFLTPLRAQGAGPDIVISDDRVLIPVESLNRGIEPVHTFAGGRWIAHSPGHLVYPCPTDLRAVNFGFGMEAGSYRNDDPHQRTNGVEVVVEFRDDENKSIELFRRYLDPYHNPGDRGEQHGRIELPGRWGRIVFHMQPGLYNDAAYDWSYWTDFTGEASPSPSRTDQPSK
jgi:4-amino-4-deoxy-L-arabinose transferase-like glycosyltransferase